MRTLLVLLILTNQSFQQFLLQPVSKSESFFSNEALVSVRFPPENVTIKDKSYYYHNFELLTLEAGDLIQVDCESFGGNPSPELIWSLNGLKVASSNKILNEKIKTSSRFSLPLTRKDNLAVVKCSVIHPALKYEMESTIILNVLYAPHIQNHSPKKYELHEGDSVTFNCEVNSNPTSYVYWYRSGIEGRTMVGSGSILNLHNLSRTDATLYQCWTE